MPVLFTECYAAIRPLRRELTLLEDLDVDPRSIRSRSTVFERQIPATNTHRIEGGPAFVKVYTYKKHPFQRFLRQGRCPNETRNLLFFRKIGIAAPKVLAWGQRKNRLGRIVEEFIITEAIVGAIPIDQFVARHCPDRSRPVFRQHRDAIIRQVGQWTRAIHSRNFFHRDLYWRNVLARVNSNGEPEVFWIDCPNGRFHFVPAHRRHLQIKDFATLDKKAWLNCSADERRLFVDAYFADEGDPESNDRFAREVARYRKRRFDPEDIQEIHAARKNRT